MHRYLQRPTHTCVHELLQQLGKMLQTQLWHGQLLQPPVGWGVHMLPQAPQSLLQVWQFSPSDASHLPLPQVHIPQSFGQLMQVSVPLQVPSPHTGQAPQSFGHVEQVSPSAGWHWPFPQHEPQSAGQV